MSQKPIELSEQEAKPCPFCGRQPTVGPWHDYLGPRVHVTCPAEDDDDCAIPAMVDETREKALRRWNTRAGDGGAA